MEAVYLLEMIPEVVTAYCYATIGYTIWKGAKNKATEQVGLFVLFCFVHHALMGIHVDESGHYSYLRIFSATWDYAMMGISLSAWNLIVRKNNLIIVYPERSL